LAPVSHPNLAPPQREKLGVNLRDRFAGVLLGTAIGDALWLPMEGMGAAAIARTYPRIDRFFLLGRTGFVSDDTEQSALVAQSLARHPQERERFVRASQWSLLGWFLRLPWGIGFGTLRACLRIALGFRKTGVSSAGNGAAMRAAIVGTFFYDAPATRRDWVDEVARVTHLDKRAVEGARFVAELAAQR
jgi:ADP-ribosyl-[dinitrogen reductase] hydrolase